MNNRLKIILYFLFLIMILIIQDFFGGKYIEMLDFTHTFYVAGYIISHHLDKYLYSFTLFGIDSKDTNAFSYFAHILLKHLDKNLTPFYFYPPSTALIFAPFSLLNLSLALFLWHIVSLISLVYINLLLINKTTTNFKPYFYEILFMPLVVTILMGQINIVLGLLPLAIAYHNLNNKKYFTSGLALSFILLKPQYLPISLLIIGSHCLIKNFRILLGFVSGFIFLILSTMMYTNTNIFIIWFKNFKIFDQLFYVPNYPIKLIASLPSCISIIVMQHFNKSISQIIYLFLIILSIHCLYLSLKLLQKSKENFKIVYLLGIAILPVISPHLLFYDLNIFLLAGIIIFSNQEDLIQFKKFILPIWTVIFINGQIIIPLPSNQIIPSIITQAILLINYIILIYTINTTILKNKYVENH